MTNFPYYFTTGLKHRHSVRLGKYIEARNKYEPSIRNLIIENPKSNPLTKSCNISDNNRTARIKKLILELIINKLTNYENTNQTHTKHSALGRIILHKIISVIMVPKMLTAQNHGM